MKTRQEMIYDFMLALAANGDIYDMLDSTVENSHEMTFEEATFKLAASFADEYLKGL
jgi:hypothetical protein